jgi:hypothetical protein
LTRFEDRLDAFDQRPRRTAIGWGLSIIAAVAILSVAGGVVFGVTNLFTQAGRVVAKTIDADNVIYTYEFFRQQYQDVVAIDGKIAEMSAGAAAASGDEQVRLNSIVLGLKTKRAQMVADYNAKASMANRSIFLAGLPNQIQ